MIGTPLVQDGRFRIPTRRFRNLGAGWRMAVQLMESVCLEEGQRGVRVSADGDDEAGGKGELYAGAEEEGETRGDAVGPVVAGAVASVMVRSGIVGGPVGSGDVVSSLVPSSLVASSKVVFPATNVFSDAIGFVRSTYGRATGGVSEEVPFRGVSRAAASASAPTNATPKSTGASTSVRGKSAREATTSRSARYAARTHPGRHASTTNQESKCSGTLPSGMPERIVFGNWVGQEELVRIQARTGGPSLWFLIVHQLPPFSSRSV